MIRATTTLKRKNLNNKKGIDNEKSTGKYTARDFVDNLTLSIETSSDSIYPEKADKVYKINDLVDLRLINKKTYIYINNKRFIQCFHILLNIDPDNIERYERIRNIDEASQLLGNSFGQRDVEIAPEEEFMAHCSNIQAFFENGLNTDILHSNIAFPLLRKLVRSGYKPAERVFKEEIAKRYNEGTLNSRVFLKSEGYLKYLDEEEKQALKEDINNLKGISFDIKVLEEIFDREYHTEVILDEKLRTVKEELTEIKDRQKKKSDIRDRYGIEIPYKDPKGPMVPRIPRDLLRDLGMLDIEYDEEIILDEEKRNVKVAKKKSDVDIYQELSDVEELPTDKDSLYQELIALEGKRYSLEKNFKHVEKSYNTGSIDDLEYQKQSDEFSAKLENITTRINKIRRVISSL